jgi:hypothetical protein
VITARPYRRGQALIDIPGMVVNSATRAGLVLVEECAALIAAVRNGVIVPHTSFFQVKNCRAAAERGQPQWLVQHEDVLVFVPPDPSGSGA